MKGDIEERTVNTAIYIIENGATVRNAAQKFQMSKSSIHKDVTERLPKINHALYTEVRDVLNANLADRARRGGQATKIKYRRKQSANGRACSHSA